jgi:hypothetical protein
MAVSNRLPTYLTTLGQANEVWMLIAGGPYAEITFDFVLRPERQVALSTGVRHVHVEARDSVRLSTPWRLNGRTPYVRFTRRGG